MRHRERAVGRGVVLLVALAAWGCEQGREPVSAARVGILAPLSGPRAARGEAMAASARAACRRLEDGRHGWRLQPVMLDSAGDPRRAAAAIAKACDDGIRLFAGCATAACVRAAIAPLKTCDGLLLYPRRHAVIAGGDHLVLLGPAPNQHIAPAVARAVLDHGRRLWIHAAPTPYGRRAARLAEAVALAHGATVVGRSDTSVPGGPAAVARRLRAATANVVLSTAPARATLALVAALRADRQAGPTPVVATDDCGWPLPLAAGLEVVSTHPHALLATGGGRRVGPLRLGRPAAAALADGIRLLGLAVAHAGRLDRSQVRSALADVSVPARDGPLAVEQRSGQARLAARVVLVDEQGRTRILGGDRLAVRGVPLRLNRGRRGAP